MVQWLGGSRFTTVWLAAPFGVVVVSQSISQSLQSLELLLAFSTIEQASNIMIRYDQIGVRREKIICISIQKHHTNHVYAFFYFLQEKSTNWY